MMNAGSPSSMPARRAHCGAASGTGGIAMAHALTIEMTALSKSSSSQQPPIHVGSGGDA